MFSCNRSLAVLLFSVLATLTAWAQAHPVVPGFQRFFADGKAEDPRGGNLLLGELNCVSCHAVPEGLSSHVQRKQAPILTDAAARAKADFLRAYIVDPQGVKPGTTMPNVFTGMPQKEAQQKAEALVHYLASLSHKTPEQTYANIGAAQRGEALFHQVGCVACHAPRKDGAPTLPNAVSLAGVERKYTLPSLAAFLDDPLKVRPAGRMPSLNLSGQQARDLAAYLLPEVPEKAGLAYSYYEGSWQSLPDFDKLDPVVSGGAEQINTNPKKRGDQFGLRFEGALSIENEGEYKFFLASDDGSRMWIDDKVVVDNDGVHGVTEKSGTVRLGKGTHYVRVDFFEQAGGEEIRAEYQGPNIKRQPIAEAIVAAQPEGEFPSLALEIKPELVTAGRELFGSLGCAACHQVSDPAAPTTPPRSAAPLARLAVGKGCLSNELSPGVPHYDLTTAQRAALSASIQQSSARQEAITGKEAIAGTMLRMNCYACHIRDEVGGVEEARNEYFQGTQPEMGDEGRLPPHLNGTGDKLADEWLAGILAHGAKDRPYMLTRMPKFGEANVGALAAAFIAADRNETPLPSIDLPAKVARQDGWKMTGNKAFNCIGCHNFGRFKATGVQAIDLTIMTRRLREDWFKRYVRDPQAYRPGTRMPASWPKTNEEKSLLVNILDGDSDRQIQAVWDFLALGTRGRLPEGLVSDTLELIPIGEAIIYRNFIEGAGPRAIGVGYPAGVNLAFDANNLRLAMIWHGRFIDAQKHWTGRGQGFQPPAGERIVAFTDAFPFAVLENAESVWPSPKAKELGYRFRGYRLTDDQRPTFLYSVGRFEVEDFFNPKEQQAKTTLTRRLTVRETAASDDGGRLYYRAAVAGKIEELGDGWYQVGDNLKLRIDLAGAARPSIRKAGNSYELICPVEMKGKAAEIVQEYDW